MSEVNNNESSRENYQEIAKKWSVPETFIVRQNSELSSEEYFLHQKIEDIKPESEKGTGQIVELRFTTRPGDRQVSAAFTLDINPEDYDVITAGPHMWSQSISVKISSLLDKFSPLPTNPVIGRRPYEESLEDARYGYYEPDTQDKKTPVKEGRSYGFVAFRHKQTGENLMLGTIPQLDTFEKIFFGVQDGKFIVSVQKDFEGITTPRESKFKIFLGSVYSQQGKGNYANLLEAYAQELTKIKGDTPLLENSAIGFSWPAYGSRINQETIGEEIEAGKGIIDTYIIDAGWATKQDGYKVDTQKFPDLLGLARKMREAGIKPGIWVAPFALYKPKKAPESLTTLKTEDGKPARNQFPIKENYLFGLLNRLNPSSVDISIPEVRNYISQQFVELAKMGFEVFKLDFLSQAFAAKMERQDKTSIEYYRQTFQEIREKVRQQLGKEITLIGCGGPWIESIGLFNGSRMTPDSAYPLKGTPGAGILRITRSDQRINAHLYRDAAAVAARRAIPFGRVFGMIFDGIHIDPNVPLGGKRKENFNRSILALRKLGISNMFVGDSLRNLSDDVRKQWEEFVQSFKASIT